MTTDSKMIFCLNFKKTYQNDLFEIKIKYHFLICCQCFGLSIFPLFFKLVVGFNKSYIYIYIYIYICVCVCVCVHIYIYIYIYKERRERERKKYINK